MKSRTLLALALAMTILIPGCGNKISDKDGNILKLSLSEARKREEYFIRVEEDPAANKIYYEPCLQPKEVGYTSFKTDTFLGINTKSTQDSRFILMSGRDNLIPVIENTNMLIFIDDDKKIPEKFELEKFTDCGYTFGAIFVSRENESGLKFSNTKFVDGSSMKSAWDSKSNLELYILDALGGVKIGSKNIDANGVFQGLKKGDAYEFACFKGTAYETVTAKADTHYFVSESMYVMYQKDCVTMTTNGFIIISMPKDLETGYYMVNGSYFFYYDAEKSSKTSVTERYAQVDYGMKEEDLFSDETAETTDPGYIDPSLYEVDPGDHEDGGD